MILKLVCKLHVQIAGLCEAEEDRVPRGEVPRAGRGRQDAGHGLHARRQEDRQRSQHACQGNDYIQQKIVIMFHKRLQGSRQTLMFSATFPDTIRKVSSEFLHAYLFLSGEANIQNKIF